jgi:small subunit ribosomal protein S14
MAKKSSVEKNNRRMRLVKRFAAKRAKLKAVADDRSLPMEERFEARLKLAELPRNSAPNSRAAALRADRARARQLRKFKLCRIALRELASSGQIPGMVKSSW